VVVYLPVDSRKKAKKFIELAHPSMAVFIKYEFWPNFLKELEKAAVTTLLVSGIFRKDQLFFKPYGFWLKKSLNAFDHFFVQNELSRSLLEQLSFTNVTVSGDTRFDRVASILKQNNTFHRTSRCCCSDGTIHAVTRGLCRSDHQGLQWLQDLQRHESEWIMTQRFPTRFVKLVYIDQG